MCVLKSSALNSNSNGNVFGLLYSSYLYFEWVKIASLCQCFCVFIFLSCAAKDSACHLDISRLLLCRFRGHDMTNKEYALRRGVQWTFSIHSAYLLKNQSQNKKLSGSVWICVTCKLLMSVYLDIKSLYPHLKVNWNVLLCKICIARRLVVDIFPRCNAHYVPFPSGTLVARRMGNGSIWWIQVDI